jgi:hypothetical protein
VVWSRPGPERKSNTSSCCHAEDTDRFAENPHQLSGHFSQATMIEADVDRSPCMRLCTAKDGHHVIVELYSVTARSSRR